MQDAPKLRGRKAGIILSGGNLDETAMQTVLTGGTPVV
jgi:threonine dehydratase